MSPDFCIFCLATRAEIALGAPLAFYWTPNAPLHAANRCTHGCAHEFPVLAKPEPPPMKRDPKLCVRCGLHPRNPAAANNGCAHEFEA